MEEPSLFELTFFLEDTRYQYGFTATKSRVVEEWLYAYPLNKAREWYRREWDIIAKKPNYVFTSSSLKGRKQSIADETGENRLFLSWAASRNHEQLLPLYEWFKGNLRELPPDGSLRPVTAEMAFEDPDAKEMVVELLRSADLGICDVAVAREEFDESSISRFEGIKSLNQEARGKFLQRMKEFWSKEPRFDVKFGHRGNTSDISFFGLNDESQGTRRFFSLIGPWLQSLGLGFTVFADEIHASLHPMLTRRLIEVFHNPQLNRHNGQLVMTTHDVSLMDSSLFRRDQIWLTEKDEEGAAHLYSLSDYKKKPRKEENWRRSYMAGRYGAVPVLGDFDKP
jgi:hypothetical protein